MKLRQKLLYVKNITPTHNSLKRKVFPYWLKYFTQFFVQVVLDNTNIKVFKSWMTSSNLHIISWKLDGSFFMVQYCTYTKFCPFVLFLLAIVLSVLRFTDSDYHFGIFKLFLNMFVCFLEDISAIVLHCQPLLYIFKISFFFYRDLFSDQLYESKVEAIKAVSTLLQVSYSDLKHYCR